MNDTQFKNRINFNDIKFYSPINIKVETRKEKYIIYDVQTSTFIFLIYQNHRYWKSTSMSRLSIF